MDQVLVHNRNAIARLNMALTLISQQFDPVELRKLTFGLLDVKHQGLLDAGILHNDKTQIMHALIGALSHYEAALEKETLQTALKRLVHT